MPQIASPIPITDKAFIKNFGIERKKITKNCIILPSNDADLFKGLGFTAQCKGMFYNVADTDYCNLITIKRHSFVGDCILHLSETKCENIILFGSCGGLSKEIGTKIIVEKAYNLESFSSFMKLNESSRIECYYPDGQLQKRFISFFNGFIPSTVATVSSLVLEESKKADLCGIGINCVDMETSMVFSAAQAIGKKAISFLYVTDVPKKINYYDDYKKSIANIIKSSKKSMANRIMKFVNDS